MTIPPLQCPGSIIFDAEVERLSSSTSAFDFASDAMSETLLPPDVDSPDFGPFGHRGLRRTTTCKKSMATLLISILRPISSKIKNNMNIQVFLHRWLFQPVPAPCVPLTVSANPSSGPYHPLTERFKNPLQGDPIIEPSSTL